MNGLGFLKKVRRLKRRTSLAIGRALRRLSKSHELLATHKNKQPYPARVPRLSVAMVQSWKVLTGARTHKQSARFDALTPAHLAGRDYLRYSGELLRALRLPKVRNIAVTGGYGAGKSSFIQSFAEDHREYNYGFVSLASFNGLSDSNKKVDDFNAKSERAAATVGRGSAETIEVARVEAAIVQQLLYSVKDSSIPQTRLKRINHVSLAKSALYASLTVATAVAILRILGLPEGYEALARVTPIKQVLESSLLISCGVTLFSALLLATKCISSILNFSIQGISLKGVSLAQSASSSVLHKDVDEILYLFERNKIDVIFIEDLDRFSDVGIFTRMREINFIINLSPSIKRAVHFVYLIKDDLFEAEDRVKFFDYVIPVVSVINTDNSKRKMLDIIARRGWDSDYAPDEAVVEAISYYVDDMRQLVNLLNEYDLFRSVVGGGKYLDRNKTFALVFVKCMFPREYAQLLKGRGVIFDLIFSYSSWSQAREAAALEEIASVESSIADQEIGLARSEKELRTLFWAAAADQESDHSLDAITIPSGERLSFREFIGSESLNESLGSNSEITLHFAGRAARRIKSKILLGAGPGSLEARMQSVRHVANGAQSRLSSLRAARARDRVVALSQAVVHQDFRNFVATKANEKDVGAIGFLISNGLLGEDYFDYSGYFYEGSISRRDKDLMLRIRAGEVLPVDSNVDNPHGVMRRLGPADLMAGRGLIVDLVIQLYSEGVDGSQSQEKLRAMLADSHLHLGRMDSLLQGIISSECLPLFVEDALRENPHVLISVMEGSHECAGSPWREMICGSIISSDNGRAAFIGEELAGRLGVIVAGLSDAQAFAASIRNRRRAKDWLDDNGIWIERIDGPIDKESSTALIDMNAITMSIHNIRVLADAFSLEWARRNFSIRDIRETSENALSSHLLKSPLRAISAVLEQEGSIEEDADQILWALHEIQTLPSKNWPNMTGDLIEKLSFKIDSLAEVSNSVWVKLCVNGRINPSWGNLKLIVDGLAAEDCAICLAALLSSELNRDMLAQNISELGRMDRVEVGALISSLFSIRDQEIQVARLLGTSGAILLAPQDSISSISDDLCKELVRSMDGRWSDWLFERVQSFSPTSAGEYLRNCISGEIVVGDGLQVAAETFLSALLTSSEEEAQALFDKCLPRVIDWTTSRADQAIDKMRLSSLDSFSPELSVMKSEGGALMLVRASVASSVRLLNALVRLHPWADIKPLVMAASEGALATLADRRTGVSLELNEVSRAFSEALHTAAVIRRPTERRRRIVLHASSRF